MSTQEENTILEKMVFIDDKCFDTHNHLFNYHYFNIQLVVIRTLSFL